MNHLSPAEQTSVVQAITEQHGHALPKQSFIENCFNLFEDISGMEGITTRDAMRTINLLWAIYREQI